MFPGANYVWLTADEIRAVHTVTTSETQSFAHYESHVGGRTVLPTLRAAVGFLLDDVNVAKLRHV